MPEQKCPQGIFVHWWVTQKGKEKISKSKGGAEPIVEAAVSYGVDAMRLYYLHIGSPFVDIEWDSDTVLKYKNRVINIWKLVQQISVLKEKKQEDLDSWLKSILQRRIKKVLDAFVTFDLRVASNEIFFEIQKDIQWYIKRGGANKGLLNRFIHTWIVLMTPVTPHLAEELWETQGQKGFVSNVVYPEFDPKDISEKDEVGEYLLSRVIEDTNEIIKVTKIVPHKICIYTSPAWKQNIFRKALALTSENKFNVGQLIKDTMANPEMKPLGQQVSQYVAKIAPEIKMLSENDRGRFSIPLDEKEHLSNAKTYLKETLGSDVEIYSSDDTNIYDPAKKIKFATPLRPAIYIE
jgi:leucyl-tRNA synthetase